LTDAERHSVDSLRDEHQFAFPKEILGLLTQLNSHGVLSSRKVSPIPEENNLTAAVNIPSYLDLREPPAN